MKTNNINNATINNNLFIALKEEHNSLSSLTRDVFSLAQQNVEVSKDAKQLMSLFIAEGTNDEKPKSEKERRQAFVRGVKRWFPKQTKDGEFVRKYSKTGEDGIKRVFIDKVKTYSPHTLKQAYNRCLKNEAPEILAIDLVGVVVDK